MCKVLETKRTLCVQGRGERSERLELGELCGEQIETRKTARTQIIRKPWKGVTSEGCRNVLRVQHCQLAFFEYGQAIIYLKGRKEGFARPSFWKELSWMLTSGPFLSITSGAPWVQIEKEETFHWIFLLQDSSNGNLELEERYYWYNQEVSGLKLIEGFHFNFGVLMQSFLVMTWVFQYFFLPGAIT